MMASPATITENNIPREYVPWMGTTTPREEDVLEEKSHQPIGPSPLTTSASVITANGLTNATIASQVIIISPDDTSGWGSRRNISTGSTSQMTITPSLSEFRLVSLGMQLAKKLAHTLDQIRVYNEQAIYPIVSILEPFIEATEELNLDMPPKSSRRVTINITHRGKAKPEFYAE